MFFLCVQQRLYINSIKWKINIVKKIVWLTGVRTHLLFMFLKPSLKTDKMTTISVLKVLKSQF